MKYLLVLSMLIISTFCKGQEYHTLPGKSVFKDSIRFPKTFPISDSVLTIDSNGYLIGGGTVEDWRLKNDTFPPSSLHFINQSDIQLSIIDDTGYVFYYSVADTSMLYISDSLRTIKWLIKTIVENTQRQMDTYPSTYRGTPQQPLFTKQKLPKLKNKKP